MTREASVVEVMAPGRRFASRRTDSFRFLSGDAGVSFRMYPGAFALAGKGLRKISHRRAKTPHGSFL
jgi:hypothetical protein